jgi:hypothetical protein
MSAGIRVSRRLIVVVALVLAAAAGAAAQDYYYTTFRFGHVDHVLPDAPCLTLGSVSPVVYDRSAWVFYTCADGRVIGRRFHHPNDNASPDYSHVPAAKPSDPTATSTPAPACDASKQVGVTGLNECQWAARYR